MRLWRLRVLRGIGVRHVDRHGIEVRCHQCNGRLPLFSPRGPHGLVHCPNCRRA